MSLQSARMPSLRDKIENPVVEAKEEVEEKVEAATDTISVSASNIDDIIRGLKREKSKKKVKGRVIKNKKTK